MSRSLPSFRDYDCCFSQGISKPKHNDDFSTTNDSFLVNDTTLFDPIPYDGMDKDEKDFIEDQIKQIYSHIDLTRKRLYNGANERQKVLIEKNLKHMYDLDLDKLTGFNNGKRDVKGGPVLQVTCITICNDKELVGAEGYIVHGTISGTDYVGNSVFIYDRKPDDPEAELSADHELSLTSCPIAPMRGNGLAFNLFNSRGEEIFSTNTYVDYKFNHNCEEDEEVVVHGNFGFYAKMLCSIIPFAVIAKVTMKLIGPPHPKTIKVEGEIIANYFTFLKQNTFKLEKGRKIEAVFNVEQTRTVLAVPVYSFLHVEFELTSRGTDFARGALSKDPYKYEQEFTRAEHYCKKDGYYFSLRIEWIHPDEYFGILPQVGAVTSDYYAEVFSIFVGGGDSALPVLCGSIVVQDEKETAYIFSRNSRCPDNLSSNGFRRILSLAWPTNRWVLEKKFYMHLKLKDAKNRPVCRGSLSWFDDCDSCPKRFDKRMCAVIPGEDGYFVAVHYSIFKDGLRAKVTVNVECGDIYDQFDIYGSVCAQYSNHDYRSAYDKEYYQIINFNRSYEYRAKVKNCSEIPLSKSLVTAPLDCTGLQVFVNLTVRPYTAPDIASSDLHAIGNHLFKVDDKNSTELVFMYRNQGYMPLGRVKVNVDWSV